MNTLLIVVGIWTAFFMAAVVFKNFLDDMKGMTEEKLHDLREVEDEHFHK